MFKFENEKEKIYAMYGMLLGDGSYSSGKIRETHTNKQKFYCEWLYELFIYNNINSKIKKDFMRKTNLGDYVYSETIIEVPDKKYFENNEYFFNQNNKKIISEYVMSNISIFGILLWYLDDGSLIIHKSIRRDKYSMSRWGLLNTQSFTYDENISIQKMFKSRFDIDTRIHKDDSGFAKGKTYFRIYINAINFRKFFDLMSPYLEYIPKQFYYKFNMRYEKNRIKDSFDFSKKYNLI